MGRSADAGGRTGTDGGRRRARLASLLIASSLLGAAAVFGPLVADAAQRTAVRTMRFDIPAQPLAAAIAAFVRVTGWEVGFASQTVAGKRSAAISGAMTPAEALDALLAGTAVSAAISGPSTAALVSTVAGAGAAPDGALLLDTITVTGAQGRDAPSGAGYRGTPDWVYETAASVGVVSREALQSSGARNVRDAIADAAGVYSGEGQGSFPTVSPIIRGVGDSGRVVVSIDGARQNAQDGGRYGGGLGGYGTAYVDSAFVRRADIEKNPDASAGSAGSLGGSVDFRTVNADDIIAPRRFWGVELDAVAGSNASDFQGSMIAATRLGEVFSLTAGFSRTDMGDYEGGENGEVTASNIYNMTGRESWSSLLKLEGEFDDVRTSLSWMHQQNDFSYSPTGTMAGSDFDARNDSVSAALGWDPDSPFLDVKATLWLNRSSSDEVRQARILDGVLIWPETEQERDLTSFGGVLENTSAIETGAGPLTFNYGVEAFRDDGSSAAMNDDIAADPRYASGYLQFNRPGQRDVASAFLNETCKPADWLAISGGLRYDWYRLHGTSTYYRYQAAASYTAGCNTSEYDYRIAYVPSWDPSTASNALVRILKNRCGEIYAGSFYTAGSVISALSTPESYPETTLDIDRTDGALLPSATVEFVPFEGLRPYMSYAHSFRPPTVNEAFFSGGVSPTIGIDTSGAANEALGGESARTWEIGVNLSRDHVFAPDDSFRLKAAAFHRTIEDYIVLGYIRVPEVDEDLLSFVNADADTTMKGLEIEANYDAGAYWIGGAATWLETTWPDKTQTFSNGSGTTTGEIFAFAGAVPPRFKVSLDVGVRSPDRKVTFGAHVNHVTPNLARYLDANGELAETGDPYTTLDLDLSLALGPHATFNVSVNNVTDQRYIPATGNYIAPGRTFLAALRTRF